MNANPTALAEGEALSDNRAPRFGGARQERGQESRIAQGATPATGQASFCPISLMVRYWRTMAVTGDGELGFDSGEGA